MRAVIALSSALLAGPSLADSVRHLTVPERFWGTWAPNANLCRDDKSITVVSSQGYVTSQAKCAIQWVTETAGAQGPIYSAHMRCSSLAAPEQITESNRIIIPKDDGQLAAGADFTDLTNYERCPADQSK